MKTIIAQRRYLRNHKPHVTTRPACDASDLPNTPQLPYRCETGIKKDRASTPASAQLQSHSAWTQARGAIEQTRYETTLAPSRALPIA